MKYDGFRVLGHRLCRASRLKGGSCVVRGVRGCRFSLKKSFNECQNSAFRRKRTIWRIDYINAAGRAR